MQEKIEIAAKKHNGGLKGYRTRAVKLLNENNLYSAERQQSLNNSESPLVKTKVIIDLHKAGYLTPNVEHFIWNMENVGYNSCFVYTAGEGIKELKDKGLLSDKLLQDAISLDIAHNFFKGVVDHQQHLLSNAVLYQLALTVHQPSEFLDNYFKLVGKASILGSQEIPGWKFNGPRLIELLKNSPIEKLTLVRAMIILAAAKFNEEAIYKIIQELPQHILGEEELIITRVKIIAHLKTAKYNQTQNSLNRFMDLVLLDSEYHPTHPSLAELAVLPLYELKTKEPKRILALFTKSKDLVDNVITENVPPECQLGALQLFYAEETTPGVFTRDHVAILKQAFELGRTNLEILRIATVIHIASAINFPLVPERMNALMATPGIKTLPEAIKIYFNDLFPGEIVSKIYGTDPRYAYILHLIKAKQFNLLTFKLIICLPQVDRFSRPNVYPDFLAKLSQIGFINEEFVDFCISRPKNFVDLLNKYLVKLGMEDNLENCNAIFRHRHLFFNQEVCDFIHYQMPDHLITQQVVNRIVAICSTPGATPQQLLTYLRGVLNPPAAGAAAAQPENPFEGAQTVHTKSINASTAQSARNLNDRYKTVYENPKEFEIYKNRLKAWFQITSAKCDELALEYQFLMTQEPRDTKKVEDLQLELLKLSSIDKLNDLFSATYVEPSSQVHLRRLVVLIWIALHDRQLCTASEEDAERLFLEALYEIKRGYNINKQGVDNRQKPLSICSDGSFKKLVEKLNGVHPDIVQEFYTPKTLTIKFNAVTKEKANRYLRLTLERSEIEFRELIKDDDLMEKIWEEIKADVEKEMRYFYQHIFDKDSEMLKAFMDNLENGQYTKTSELEILRPEVYEKIISENALAKTENESFSTEGSLSLELSEEAVLSRVPNTEPTKMEIDSEEEAEAPKSSSAAAAAAALDQRSIEEGDAIEIEDDYGSSRKNKTKFTGNADEVEPEVPASSAAAAGAEEMKADKQYESLNRRPKKRVASPEQSDEDHSETEEDVSEPLKKKTKGAHTHRSNFFGPSSFNIKPEQVDEDYELAPAASSASSLSFFAAQPARKETPAAAASYSNPQRHEQ